MIDGGLSIREATVTDAAHLDQLLSLVSLSAHGVLAPGTRYWLVTLAGGDAIGAIGLEYGAASVLLRSAAVLPAWRGQGVGAALVRWALTAAEADGIDRIYLFSTGAGPYWAHFGFREVSVPELVAALPDAPQVRHFAGMGWLPDEVAWRKDLNIGL